MFISVNYKSYLFESVHLDEEYGALYGYFWPTYVDIWPFKK